MNILISANSAYIKIISVMVYSLCKSNPAEEIDLYLAHRDMSDEDLSIFQNILSLFENKTLHPIYMANDITEKFNASDRFSVETYYRIFALDKLPLSIDRILYLDGDMIINGSLAEVYTTEMSDFCPFVVCEDIDGHIRDAYSLIKNREGIPDNHKCFNAGFMLINLNYMRRHNNIEYIKEAFCREHANYSFHDQDILNHMFYDRVKYVPWEYYNLPAEWWYLDAVELTKGRVRYATYKEINNPSINKSHRFIDITSTVKENAVVIHFFGLLKPWIYTKENIYPDVAFYADLWNNANTELRSRVANIPPIN